MDTRVYVYIYMGVVEMRERREGDRGAGWLISILN